MTDIIIKYGPIALTVIGACSVIAAAIAPLTKSKIDDKLAGALSKLHAIISKLALNPKP